MAQSLARAFKRPLFVGGVAVLAAAWIARFTPIYSPFVLLAGGLIAAVLILADIARTRRHGY